MHDIPSTQPESSSLAELVCTAEFKQKPDVNVAKMQSFCNSLAQQSLYYSERCNAVLSVMNIHYLF
jgi:hypothetical protein